MRIPEFYGNGRPVFSFEFFPPKTDEAARALLETAADLRSAHAPDFVSVTYGAGGSTRDRTLELVSRIQGDLSITAMAHLTCVGHTREELHHVMGQLVTRGIRNVLALRGDPPKGGTAFQMTEGGFAHGSELASFLKEHYDVSVAGACYPETHPESASPADDMEWTRHKIDCGMEVLVSQLFFDTEAYFAYVDRARAAGIQVPIVPGIMPITNVSQIERFTEMCGATIPTELYKRLQRFQDDPPSVMAIGIEHAIRQCRTLLEGSAPGLHFYTLNKSHATRSILAAIKEI